MPVISNLVFTKTASTIVATWDTDASSDSNLFVNGQAALDNGAAANRTTGHQCVKAGLLPSTTYSCFVISGGTSSSPQNVTTNALDTRILVTSAKNGAVTLGNQNNNFGDTQRTFLSNDNIVYVAIDDGKGIVAGTPNAGFNVQIGALTNEVTMTGTNKSLSAYGGIATFNGTDGPAGAAMTNKSSGIFGINGNLHFFVYRQLAGSSNRYCNWIKSTDKGATWNNFTAPSTFLANGNPVSPNSPAEPVQFYVNTLGLVTPVLYAADDGTLGYNTAGNQIDGGNAYVYMTFIKDNDNTTLFLMRLPRIQFDAQNAAPMQYWAGPAFPSPLDFVNDVNWSSSPAAAVNIKPVTPGLLPSGIWNQPVFIPAINSYVMSYSNSYDGVNTTLWVMYSAPTPAGPWQIFFTQPNAPFNSYYTGFFPFHRDVAGNVATSNIGIKCLYSTSPSGAGYQINYSTLTMLPASGAAMTQLAFYGFTTVENPLSGGGLFTTCPSLSALKVISSGVCEATATSTHCGAYWSAAIPSGDIGGTWPADHYAEISVGSGYTADSTGYFIPMVRQSSSQNTAYRAFMQFGASNCLFQAIVNGSPTTLVTFTFTPVAGDVLRFSVTGNVLTLTQNGTVIQSFTDVSNLVPGPGFPAIDLFAATITNEQISSFAAGANQAAAPTFSPIGGSYPSAQTVTITGPSGSTIYYTTDGSTPTRSSSSFATGGTVAVGPGQTLKAISSKANFADSQVGGSTYTISSGGSGGIGGGSKKSFNFKLKL